MECVERLHEWIIQEAEFQTVAAETLFGPPGKRRDSSHTFFGQTSSSGKPVCTKCRLCKKDHPVWSCVEFKKMEVQSRWQKAKKLRLRYRCLGIEEITREGDVLKAVGVVLMAVRKHTTGHCMIISL